MKEDDPPCPASPVDVIPERIVVKLDPGEPLLVVWSALIPCAPTGDETHPGNPFLH